MQRRQLVLDKIAYIGKEANELEETETFGLDSETYAEYLPRVNADNKAR
ncbi:MAG: hypothetical protein ACLP9D_06700 [Candidatus Bathyarchaeia archaeon]